MTGLASVAFRVTDLGQARRFYTELLGFQEAFTLSGATGRIERVFLKVNDEQFIELLPGLQPGERERLAHVAIQCEEVREVHRQLRRHGLTLPPVEMRPDGNPGFRLVDPGGTPLEFLEYSPGGRQQRARGKFLDSGRISPRLWHAGVVVFDLDKAMSFYAGLMGFREIWRGGPTEQELRWVNMQMPGRGDYIEFMLASQTPDRQQTGSMQHVCLQVPDVQAAYLTLLRRGLPDEERFRPRIGRNGRRLANLFDPDGSRIEIMEAEPAIRGPAR